MKRVFLIIFLTCFCCTRGFAQESMFGFTKIDFFNPDKPITHTNEGPKYTQIENASVINETGQKDIWTEPIVGPGGNIVYYRPPKQVIEFLDHPTEENAREYLEWNMSRLDKIHQAQNMLKKVTLEMGTPANVVKTEGRAVRDVSKLDSKRWTSGQNYVAFFLLKGCPYCEQQKQVIRRLKETRPDVRVEVFVKGYADHEINNLPFKAIADQGVSQSLGFSRYPTTLIVNEHGKKALVPGVISNSLINDILEGRS